MAVETDTERAIFLNLNDFGVAVTYGAAVINGVFDNETIEVPGPGMVPMLQEQPTVEVRTSDVSSIAQDDVMVISGVTYHVTDWFHDGKGMTKVNLEKQ